MGYAETLPADMDAAEVVQNLKDKFGKDVKVERVIAAEGENPITDYLGFGKEKPENKSSRWKVYAALRGKVIAAPEESADVRGAVVTDYQELLEKQWINDLHNRYKTKVNKKVLKQVK